MDEWQAVAERIRNWGRWGLDDQLGTLNYITASKIIDAAKLVRHGRVIPLGIPLDSYGPQTQGLRTNPIHAMTVIGADESAVPHLDGFGGTHEARIVEQIRSGPGRFNDDYITMYLQAGTQLDGFAHFYYDGLLYNGFPAASVTAFGATKDSIDQVAAAGQIVSRGVLLDVPRHRGVDSLPGDALIFPDELEATVASANLTIGTGDVVLIRTGWWPYFKADRDDRSRRSSWPGLSWTCAEWFHDHEVAAVAADNIAVEGSTVEAGVWNLFHMLALRDMGMPLGEIFDLEALAADCASDGIYEFQLIAQPLQISGAVASPLHPLAIK
jgi:kynurenine formamidase